MSDDCITFVYSNRLKFPVVLANRLEQRVYIEWRGLPLASPISLETVEAGIEVKIEKAWMEDRLPFLKLQHPNGTATGTVDYGVLWVTRSERCSYALLRMAPDWPGDDVSNMLILTRAEDRKLVTLTDEQFLKALQDVQEDMATRSVWHASDAQALFGPMPDRHSLEYQSDLAECLRSQGREQKRKICCVGCEGELSEEDDVCANCGDHRAAPECPHCNQRVSPHKSARVRYREENGHYPWHFGWNGKCLSCGFTFECNEVVETGHHTFFSPNRDVRFKDSGEGSDPCVGQTAIQISLGESIFSVCDWWDYQPTVVVTLRRLQDANIQSDGSLPMEQSIVLTPTEWQAIAAQLNGPLNVLLKRRPWSRDTT